MPLAQLDMGQPADGFRQISGLFDAAADAVHPRIDGQMDLDRLVLLHCCSGKFLRHLEIIDRLCDVVIDDGFFMFFRHRPQDQDGRHDPCFAQLNGFLGNGNSQITRSRGQRCRGNRDSPVAIGIRLDNRTDLRIRLQYFPCHLDIMGNGGQIDFRPDISCSHRPCHRSFIKLADGVGFEPTIPCGILDFESSTFDHSDTHPHTR